MTALELLQKHWGYQSFRPLQEDIIASVLAGQDTLALLPTGGGKSVCFQVPALAQEGICLVISPLIALMKDQVEQLQRRGIKALAVHAGLHRKEVDIALDNCIYDQVKFLYLSPERLQTELFRERVKKMQVSFVAVDEAHCISQWGYDFRPSYLQIAELRKLLPGKPVMALTASATPLVKQDIQEKLQFRKGSQVFQQTFARPNLSYSCRQVEDKEEQLLQVLQRLPGTSVVYVRSRKRTVEIAKLLQQKGIPATWYHAGLTFEERDKAQRAWISGRTRVVVATNAFGMGIDKPDVRSVIHLEVPDTLEAYYQEAGRAGRDGKYAFAVALYQPHDLQDLQKRIEDAHPPAEVLKRVYQALANYYQLAVGGGLMQTFPFDLEQFSATYKLKPKEVHHALAELEAQGLVQLSQGYHAPSTLLFTAEKLALYEYQLANPQQDLLIQLLLRTYGGEVFTNFVRIREVSLAQQLKVPVTELKKQLELLQRAGLVVYQPGTDQPQLTFTTHRHDAAHLPLDYQRLKLLKEQALEKAKAVAHYTQQPLRCRTQLLLEYFGELSEQRCRICDNCLAWRKQQEQAGVLPEHYQPVVLDKLKQAALLPKDVAASVAPKEREQVLEAIRQLLDSGQISYNQEGKLQLT